MSPDSTRVPSSIWEIIGDYGRSLEGLKNNNDGSIIFRPISVLPHSKEKIKAALIDALAVSKSHESIESIKVGLMALHFFIPDNEVKKANQNFFGPKSS